jgi:hypothetical protein
LAPDADITFERLAVTQEQIAAWSLPTRPTKASDAIEEHLPRKQFEILKAAETSEREIISKLVGGLA